MPSTSRSDSIYIEDGVSNSLNVYVRDADRVESNTEQVLLNGNTVRYLEVNFGHLADTVFGREPGDAPFNGLDHPSVEEPNLLAADYFAGWIGLATPDARPYLYSDNGIFREITTGPTPAAVPLPAGLPLFATGLLTLALLRRKRG